MSRILDGLPEEGSMTPSDEAVLANEIQKHQKEEDKNLLVLANMREAVRYGMGLSKGRISEGEIFSIVYTALLKASKNFIPGGIRFFAYAKPYIRGDICLFWKRVDVVKNSYENQAEEEPAIKRFVLISGACETETDCYSWEDKRLVPDFVEPDFKGIDLREKWSIVEPVMETTLNEREQMILKLFYISGFTFENISQKLVPKISSAAVKYTHSRALRKLRSALLKNKTLFHV